MAATAKEGVASAAPSLEQYCAHARRSTSMVFETAAGLVHPFERDLPFGELGALSLRLQHLDPGWRLPKADHIHPELDPFDGLWKAPGGFAVRGIDAKGFAMVLIDEGWIPDDACRAAMISRSTLRRALRGWRDQPRFEWHADQPATMTPEIAEVLALIGVLHETPHPAKWPSEAAFLCGVGASNGHPVGTDQGQAVLTGAA